MYVHVRSDVIFPEQDLPVLSLAGTADKQWVLRILMFLCPQ